MCISMEEVYYFLYAYVQGHWQMTLKVIEGYIFLPVAIVCLLFKYFDQWLFLESLAVPSLSMNLDILLSFEK